MRAFIFSAILALGSLSLVLGLPAGEAQAHPPGWGRQVGYGGNYGRYYGSGYYAPGYGYGSGSGYYAPAYSGGYYGSGYAAPAYNSGYYGSGYASPAYSNSYYGSGYNSPAYNVYPASGYYGGVCR